TQPATGEQGITVPDVARNGSTPHAAAAPRPVFILGTPYSGNSIVSWALAQHPNFSHVLETGWLVNLATELHRVYQGAVAEPATSQLVALSISASEFVSRFGDAADRVLLPRSPSAPQTPQRWVDCTPAHAHQVPVLLELFPEAKFIHVLYDVSSVVRS